MAETKKYDKIIDEFAFSNKDAIGSGQFGSVYKGVNTKTQETVAIKVITLSTLKDQYLHKLLQNEVDALAKLHSPNIVRFIALKITMNNIYVITEFCEGGDLAHKMSKKGSLFNEEEVIDILGQVCEAFKEMKKYSVIHRDLKPANILLHQGLVKIADLGFAKTVQNFQFSVNTSTVGSPIYMSPQVLLRQFYTSKCDIWSLGVILYQLLYGKVPWVAMDMQVLANLIMTKPVDFKKEVPVSSEMIDLIRRCLRFHEKDRISWDELFNHPVILKKKPVTSAKGVENTIPQAQVTSAPHSHGPQTYGAGYQPATAPLTAIPQPTFGQAPAGSKDAGKPHGHHAMNAMRGYSGKPGFSAEAPKHQYYGAEAAGAKGYGQENAAFGAPRHGSTGVPVGTNHGATMPRYAPTERTATAGGYGGYAGYGAGGKPQYGGYPGGAYPSAGGYAGQQAPRRL